MDAVLVLLPPSETKRDGGDGPPLASAALSFPELDPLRKELVDELVELAADVPAQPGGAGAVAAPGRGGAPQRDAVDAHRRCRRCTATPACSTTHSTPARCGGRGRAGAARGWRSGRRCSGCCAPTTRCRPTGCPPARRCPAGRRSPPAGGRCSTRCSRRSPPARRWSTCAPGSYAALGRVPGAVTVNVLAERPDGRRQRRQPLQQGAQGPAGPGARGHARGAVGRRRRGGGGPARRDARRALRYDAPRRDRPRLTGRPAGIGGTSVNGASTRSAVVPPRTCPCTETSLRDTRGLGRVRSVEPEHRRRTRRRDMSTAARDVVCTRPPLRPPSKAAFLRTARPAGTPLLENPRCASTISTVPLPKTAVAASTTTNPSPSAAVADRHPSTSTAVPAPTSTAHPPATAGRPGPARCTVRGRARRG